MAASGGHWKGGSFVAAGSSNSVNPVDFRTAELARMRGEIPTIPENIGSRENPLKTGAGEVFRENGSWFFRNPKSQWMGNTWLRSDPKFQDRYTIGYSRR